MNINKLSSGEPFEGKNEQNIVHTENEKILLLYTCDLQVGIYFAIIKFPSLKVCVMYVY